MDERDLDTESVPHVMEEIRRRTADMKEARILVVSPPAIPGIGQSSGFTFELQQTTSSDDIREFEGVLNRFLAAVRSRPEIANAFSFFTARTPGYQVDVDREKAKKLGVSVSEAYSTLSTLLASSYVNDFNIYGRNFRVVAQADTSFRRSIDDIGKYHVRNSAGGMVPLSALITSKVIETPALVSHYNLYRSAEIMGAANQGYRAGSEAPPEIAAKICRSLS